MTNGRLSKQDLGLEPRESLVLVTGAAGFVGQGIVRRLLAEGCRVRALVLAGDPAARELRRLEPRANLDLVEGDVTDAACVAAGCARVTHVFHTAALVHAWAPWARFRAVNVWGTENVARAAHAVRVARMVHVSTSDVFGIPIDDAVLDESSPYRRWHEPYADTKIEAERWLWEFQRASGLPLSVIYPGWVYGPGDKAFFPGLAEAIGNGPMLFWRRHVRLPWVYLENLVDACLLAATHPQAVGRGYLVHEGEEGPTLQDVCGRIADCIGAKQPTLHLPYPLVLATAWLLERLWHLAGAQTPPPLRTVDVKAFGFQWHLSTRRVRDELGWAPRVDVRAGMNAALDDLARSRGG